LVISNLADFDFFKMLDWLKYIYVVIMLQYIYLSLTIKNLFHFLLGLSHNNIWWPNNFIFIIHELVIQVSLRISYQENQATIIFTHLIQDESYFLITSHMMAIGECAHFDFLTFEVFEEYVIWPLNISYCDTLKLIMAMTSAEYFFIVVWHVLEVFFLKHIIFVFDVSLLIFALFILFNFIFLIWILQRRYYTFVLQAWFVETYVWTLHFRQC